MPDGRVEFEITADGKKAFASIDQITDALQKSGVKWEKSAKESTNQIGISFEGVLKKITAAFSAAAIGKFIMNWGKAAIQAASDLEEVQNVVDVTFGESANKIEAWAKKAGDQFGLTETQAKRFTSTLGAMMKSAGMSGSEIADISTDLAGLAADMASFYNLDFDTAFNKIRSGISGETEPLKQLGINMSVANLEAFALQQGLSKTFDQMTQGEQTMLRYQYLMQATADAQGDFARTADGYANARRKLETNISQLTTSIGKSLIPVVSDAVGWINTLLDAINKEPERTIADDFADIDEDTAEKMAQVQETYAQAEALLGLLKEIGGEVVTLNNGKTVTLESLFGDMSVLEKSGGDVDGYLKRLGVDVEYITQRYQTWKRTTGELTKLIPELSSVIDKETGAIDGGTDALQRNLEEWKANEEKKIQWAAIYAKERALVEKRAELASYEFDAGAARQRVKKAADALKNIYGAEFDDFGNVVNVSKYEYSDPETQKKYLADFEHYNILLDERKQKEDELTRQTNAYNEAEAEYSAGLEEAKDRLGELDDEQRQNIQTSDEWAEAHGQAARDALTATEEALKAIDDYVLKVRESTKQQIESTVKGFSEIVLPSEARQRVKELSKELDGLDTNAKESADRIKEINREINSLGGEKVTAKGMLAGLESQAKYMEEYLANLEKARQMGFSNELLASLSDGSVESADYLIALSEASKEEVEAINAQWKAVQDGKQKMAEGLSDQKLTVDQTYQQMVDKAKETVAQLDLGQQAADASGNTVAGLAQGIADHVGDVQQQVDRIIAQLERLNGYGIDIDFGQFGNVSFNTKITKQNPMMHRSGLANVPYDGYLAELHQGEAVLTAQENAIWQRYKTGLRDAVDYDQLGGMMRDIKPGGDVFLDGRIVGRVMSALQGAQYRSLERSGWQSGR